MAHRKRVVVEKVDPYWGCTKVLGSGRFEVFNGESVEVEYVCQSEMGELVFLINHRERYASVVKDKPHQLQWYPDIIIARCERTKNAEDYTDEELKHLRLAVPAPELWRSKRHSIVDLKKLWCFGH